MSLSLAGSGALSGVDLDALTATGRLAGGLLPAGSTLQVVQTVKTDTFTASVALGGITADVMTATITPSSDTSKVLVMVDYTASVDTTTVHHAYLYRSSSASGYVGDAAGSRQRASTGGAAGGTSTGAGYSGSIIYLDSPNTDSAVTYSLRLGHAGGVTLNVYLNRSTADQDDTARARYASSITLIEVAA